VGDGSAQTEDAVSDTSLDAGDEGEGPTYSYDVPLDPGSPWPKFRRDSRQTGRGTDAQGRGGERPWSFPTGKGIFSTAVVDGDGTIYVGSADRYFYAITRSGADKWSHETGEIIDSSALLDDRGRVYVGSGDGFLYAFDRGTGDVLWKFQAEDPSDTGAFIRWFEGNVAMMPSGALLVPNDNFRVYAVDRDDGTMLWSIKMPDQTWSLPAVDASRERIFIGNNNLLPLLGDNFFSTTFDGLPAWSASSKGSVAASPLVTADGLVVVGGFDGFVRAYDADTGDEKWSFGARDHIYASPAELSDGRIIQAAADGTVVALDPQTGAVVWAFDALEPIRSSPAVGGDDRIYFGSGEGRLFCLEPDGRRAWSMRLTLGDRNDLNASVALGDGAAVVSGESGEVFRVPLDWCESPLGAADSRCEVGAGELLPDEGAQLVFLSRFGTPLLTPPATIEPNEALAFGLVVRQAGDTTLALLESGTFSVTPDANVPLDVQVSGDRRFAVVIPEQPCPAGSQVKLRFTGGWLRDPERDGLRMTGGELGGQLDQTFTFDVPPSGVAPAKPLAWPQDPGVAGTAWELRRLAAPLPTILPSYNQIGFDSLHYLVGLVEGEGGSGVAWFIGARLPEGSETAVADPTTQVLLPMKVSYLPGGQITLENDAGFAFEVFNLQIGFQAMRIQASLDAELNAPAPAGVQVSTLCGAIAFYGPFLQELGFCNPETDRLVAFGAIEFHPAAQGAPLPENLGAPEFSLEGSTLTVAMPGAVLDASAHRLGVLLIDAQTGDPVAMDYGPRTVQTANGAGGLEAVALDLDDVALPLAWRAWLMVDTTPVAQWSPAAQ
jgi:outer membrane protein assembly factor BamB